MSIPRLGATSSLNQFRGVSCGSTLSCTAVGFYAGAGARYQTLVESWDGKTWSVVPSPNVGAASDWDLLDGVSCPAPRSCTAVGYVEVPHSGYRTLIEAWHGKSWSVVPSPGSGPAAYYDALGGVSCASVTSCMAVGYSLTDRGIGGTLVESWDGKSWSVVPSPHNAPAFGSAALAGVSCASAKACVAVGAHGAISGAFRTLIESWDGKSWSVVPSPDGRPLGGSFYGVSCRSRTCTAVGSRSGKTGASGTLIESWDGNSWSVVTSPNNGTTSGHNVLYGVFCASRGSCVAVGYTSTTGVDRTLIESWDGKSWSVVPSPNSVSSPLRTVDRGFKNFSLYGVSCASLIVCGAVGSVGDGGAKSEPLVEMS